MANTPKRVVLFSKIGKTYEYSYKFEIDAAGLETFTVYRYATKKPAVKLKKGHIRAKIRDKIVDVCPVNRRDIAVWMGDEPALQHRRALRLMQDLASTLERGKVFRVALEPGGAEVIEDIAYTYDNRRRLYTYETITPDRLFDEHEAYLQGLKDKRDMRKIGAVNSGNRKPRNEPKYSKRQRIITPRVGDTSYMLDRDEKGNEKFVVLRWGQTAPGQYRYKRRVNTKSSEAMSAKELMQFYADMALPKRVVLYDVVTPNKPLGGRVIAELDHDYNATRRAYDSITNHTDYDIYTGN